MAGQPRPARIVAANPLLNQLLTKPDPPALDTAEQVYISSLSLLKMLRHGRAGVPREVMGLMLGEFVDDYTVRVTDVFAMPQTGTGISVEAVDPVFQSKMLDMLKVTGRPEMVVGWYHSHPGFECWLSQVDMNTQKSFQALSNRAVAVVIDPILSVKGKVLIDAFRLCTPETIITKGEPRQVTSNLGHLREPCMKARIHGLDRFYYSISINYRKNELEQKMLVNLHKNTWMSGLTLAGYSEYSKLNENEVQEMLKLAKNYKKTLDDEENLTREQLAIRHVGKEDPKRHLEEKVEKLMASNIVQCLRAAVDTVIFK